MKTYLIQFTYDHYCQGYEKTTITILVHAEDYQSAILKIATIYKNARHFENLTIE